jgi:hypothetical protein
MHSAQSGDRYEGEWQFGQTHGMGKMFYGPASPEASYNGSWSNGLRAGLGILVYKNGDRFEGHWRDGEKEGPGRFFYQAQNQVYEGEWAKNAPRCGQLKAAPLGSFPAAAPGSAGSPGSPSSLGSVAGGSAGVASSSLPVLRLLGPESVVSDAVASMRQDRATEVTTARASSRACSPPPHPPRPAYT